MYITVTPHVTPANILLIKHWPELNEQSNKSFSVPVQWNLILIVDSRPKSEDNLITLAPKWCRYTPHIQWVIVIVITDLVV